MTSLNKHIQDTIDRMGASWTVDDWWNWWMEEDMAVVEAGRMTASMMTLDDDVHVMHIGGTWDDLSGQYIIDSIEEYNPDAKRIIVNGRKGWERFLKMKGARYGLRWQFIKRQ